MPHMKPAKIWKQAERNHLQHLLQERHNEGRYWKDSGTSIKFFTKKMNEEFLREWVENHPDSRQFELPGSETDSDEEGRDEGDRDDHGGREAVTEKAPEGQGEDGQDSQGAQDTGDQDEEGEDSDADEERGRGRERKAGGKSGAAESRKANKKLPKREQ
ncbi:uncharacterized protein Bfra_006115 [Botrytis fragariae]|uniref:Uncharacterized protein n=1 Tax=Botrytis fragariae TaxID=1964551 RepID=A0A8H6ASE5_9HELO|nr:uncharacterized protein Bfra_006115 [Botrytis fragariae]KAF5872752.1 hypothetical protein Bfra_006115 [Botrytis fragariae]